MPSFRKKSEWGYGICCGIGNKKGLLHQKRMRIIYLDENDKPKTVSANFNKNEYDKAIKAHERGCHKEFKFDSQKQRLASVSG